MGCCNILNGRRQCGTGGGAVLSSVSAELAADFAMVITVPVYATLMSLSLTTTSLTSYLWFDFTANWLHTGAFAGNAAVNFRFLLDTVLLTGGTTDNKVRSQIGNVARNRRVPVTAGLHTIDVEISKFGAAGNLLEIRPVALPDLMHAALVLQEQT